MNRFSSLILCLLLMFLAGQADAQWSQFRGPNGSGVDTSTGYPVEFSPTKNMAWKTAVPYGQSSPVVVGTRLYLTASEADRLITISIDTQTGKEVWRRELKRERNQEAYKANDPASPTPVADENGVVAFFSELGLVSYTKDGRMAWTTRLGPFRNFYGMAGSPIIAGDTVVLVCDQHAGSFVIAVDRATGKQKWRTDRPGMTIAWSTPMVFRPNAARTDLIVLGSSRLDAYDLATGKAQWWLPVGSSGAIAPPLAQGDTLVICTDGSNEPLLPTFASVLAKYDTDKDGRLSYAEFRSDKDMGEHFGWVDDNDDKVIVEKEWTAVRNMGLGEWGVMAVRPENAKGQLNTAAIRWRYQKNIPYIPSPLLYQGVYYMVKTGGIVTALDSATGNVLKMGRANGAPGEYFASPIAADGKVFLASTEGKISILKAGGEWELLAVNDMGEEIQATPALSQGRVFVRTRGAVSCFATAK